MWKKFLLVPLSILFLFSTFPLHQAMGQASTLVSVEPTQVFGLNAGDTFSINITVSNVTDLFAWQFSLFYQSTVLNGTSATEGPFLQTGGINTLFQIENFTDNYNATYGVIVVGGARLGTKSAPARSGVSGSGTLATVTFKDVGPGLSVLHFDMNEPLGGTKLVDSNNTLIPFTVVGGEVTVIPEFPSFLVLPILMIATLLVAIVRRAHRSAKREAGANKDIRDALNTLEKQI